MTVFASLSRRTSRSRRTPSVASVVRSLGSVRITDRPDVWSARPAQHSSSATRAAAVGTTGDEVSDQGRSGPPA